jgi:hypothetical protein
MCEHWCGQRLVKPIDKHRLESWGAPTATDARKLTKPANVALRMKEKFVKSPGDPLKLRAKIQGFILRTEGC